MIDAFGVTYMATGENIASGKRLLEQVMHVQFTLLGVGYLEANGTTYWTQMFIDG